MPWPIHTMPPYIHWRRSELCQGPMERGTCRTGPTKCWWSDKKTTLPGYIYIHTHICACIICMWYYIILYIYICVCVFLNPFEPNKQTYIKLHKLGQNHGWDQDRPRTPPGALGLSCGRGSVAVAQACLLFPHAVDLLLVDGHGPWLYGGFHKWGYPQIDGLKWKIQLKWMIWGYHYIRKPLYVYIYNYIYINYKL